ncbi:MAG: hypothetical protein R3286_13015 [Gammaproteobacteria bacterium]|nr:hypothetical protein [Gammaproteobacteria bacterium]
MSIFWRSWVTVVILVAVVLGVLATLTTLQFDSILSHFIQQRLSVLAQTSRASFRAAAGLGLPLAGMRNAPAILERARQTDPNISAVHVFDVSGRILHSTDPNHTTSVRAEVLFAQSASRDDTWYTETGEHFLSGGRIHDLSGKPLGGLVIVYPKTDLATAVDAMTARLATYALGVLMLAALVAIGLLRFGLRDLVRVFTGIETAFAAIERREWRRAAGGSDPMPEPVRGLGIDTSELTRLLQAAEERYVAAGQSLARLEQQAEEAAPLEAGGRP